MAILVPLGMSYQLNEDGTISNNKKHWYDIVIERNVELGKTTVIHKGSWRNTKIKEGSKIGELANIGHNVIIGKHCLIGPSACIGGSTEIGNYCWVGMNATIKSRLKICDKVVIGMGAVVLKDITKSGIYVGNPARYLKEWDGKQPF